MSEKVDDKRISEALELLNDVARDKKAELQGMISNKYGELRSAIGNVAGKLQHDVVETYRRSTEKAKELAAEVDESVHKNPWPYLGGTALGFLILGYFLGRSKK